MTSAPIGQVATALPDGFIFVRRKGRRSFCHQSTLLGVRGRASARPRRPVQALCHYGMNGASLGPPIEPRHSNVMSAGIFASAHPVLPCRPDYTGLRMLRRDAARALYGRSSPRKPADDRQRIAQADAERSRLSMPAGGICPVHPGRSSVSGGEGGIRTLGTVAGTPHFECGAFDHSATSPRGRPGGGETAGADRLEARC